MQNSCAYGPMATAEGYRLRVPTAEKKDPIIPDIRSKTTRQFSDRQMEYAQTEQPTNYDCFPVKKMKRGMKRVTCMKKGTEDYQTLPKVKHYSYFQK